MDENSTGPASRKTGSSELYGTFSRGNSPRTRSPDQGESVGNSGSVGAGEFNLKFLFRAALRHWRVMLLSLILGLLGGVIYIQSAVRIYEAEAVVEMNVRRPRVINDAAVFEDPGLGRDTDAIFNTRFEKFRSPAMEELAVREFLKRFPEPKSPDNPVSIGKFSLPPLIRDVTWRRDPSANIVRVSFLSPHPRFAANLVNVLSDCAGILMREENREQSDEAVKWLVSQVQEQREDLEAVEKKLADIRRDVQMDALQQQRDALGQAIISVSEEREKLISDLTARQTAYDFIAGMQEDSTNLDMPVGLPKGAQLNQLVSQWREAHDEFRLLAGRYTALHPDYRPAQEKEARARERLEGFIAFTVKEVQNDIHLLEKQVEQVNQRISAMKEESLDLEQRYTAGMQRVQRLEREKDAADTSYQTLLRRMEEARRAADENMAFTKVIRKAEIPMSPIRPRKPMAIIFSLLLGGAAGLLMTVTVELWTDKVETVSDLRSMSLKVLGIIPTQKKMDSRAELATIGLRDKFSPLIEIFSGINALLASDKYRDVSQVLLLCSIMPGEGKTVSTCNMAISSALNGARTLLIDGDLRRPQLVNIFAVDSEKPSLLDWLHRNSDSVGIEDLVSRNVVENLDIITSRPCKDIHPAKLLGRGSVGDLLNWARAHYDRIIIDSPPLGLVSDAQVWGNHADSLILVSRLGKTRRRALRHTLAQFDDSGIHLLGCIANDVPHSIEGLFGGAYGYGYGSSYGYDNARSTS